MLDESSIVTDRAIADGWIAIILAVEVVVTLLYLYVFRFAMGLVMLSFWALGMCMVLRAKFNTLVTRPDAVKVAEFELRSAYGERDVV